ncbi:MAG: hypothetical protein ACRC3G_02505 [Bacteroidales bacterium]
MFVLCGTATLPRFFLRCATLTPLSPPSYHRPCGLDPQSPIYGQGSCISTNVRPQSIRGVLLFVRTPWQGIPCQARKNEQRGRGGIAG